jgi:hypothetical protein
VDRDGQLWAPKRSWKADLTPDGEGERLAGMDTVNLKAMYNDPSQLREALAWRLFARAGVPASRHTYAKLALNDTYLGLFSVIEQVDKRYLKDRFGDNDEGNLYKAACGELGCATLERRVGPDGRDDGRQYIARSRRRPDLPADDQRGRPGRQHLRGPGPARPGGGRGRLGRRRGDERGFMASPYFTFIPWDYDNSFGIDFFDTRWQDTDLVDWAASTASYGRRNSGGRLSRIPLVQHLLRNRDFLRYYLDHVEFLLDTELNPDAVAALIGAGGGLWDRVSRPAYLESDTPHGSPFTGRQFTNHEVYRSNTLQEELRRGEETAQGVVHHVRMRHDSARAQLAALRRDHPTGSGGAAFPATLEPLP